MPRQSYFRTPGGMIGAARRNDRAAANRLARDQATRTIGRRYGGRAG